MPQSILKKLFQLIFLATIVLSLSACAARPPSPSPAQGAVPPSGLESYNRAMFRANMRIDRSLLKPAAKAYGTVPQGIRVALRNAIGNLSEPYYSLNHSLQGNFDYMGGDLLRLGINSTLALLGCLMLLEPLASRNETRIWALPLGFGGWVRAPI